MMKSKHSRFFQFAVVLVAVIFPVLILHMFLLDWSWKRELFLSYCYNFSITISFYLVLLWKESKRNQNLGYYFLFFSVLKFIGFIVLVKPYLDFSQGVKGHSFISFFVPYAICMIYEIWFIIQELNKIQKKVEKNPKPGSDC